LAGFQTITIGRFWVIPEVRGVVNGEYGVNTLQVRTENTAQLARPTK
jgi:hypothetical protein